MNDSTADSYIRDQQPSLDQLLREVLPDIKLALGELIDRENSRTLPGKYARLLPATLLVVTLRPDAAETLAPVAATVEQELTDSCTRHGSLYDRVYRVQLRRSEAPDAPLYRVSAHPGHAPHEDLPVVQAEHHHNAPPLPVSDADATQAEGTELPGWQAGRWLLLVENEQGEQQEVFRLSDPLVIVGRRSDDPQLRTTVAISDAPHVSRRQLALLWQERDGAPGFRLFNTGLNPVHLPGKEIPGAHIGRDPLRLDLIEEAHTGWLPPGVPLRIGDRGPVLRIEEIPEPDDEPEDPDATRLE